MTANGYIDLLIPRGGKGLIQACLKNATVPCIETGTGICHIFVEKTADFDMALDIIDNAKTMFKIADVIKSPDVSNTNVKQNNVVNYQSNNRPIFYI